MHASSAGTPHAYPGLIMRITAPLSAVGDGSSTTEDPGRIDQRGDEKHVNQQLDAARYDTRERCAERKRVLVAEDNPHMRHLLASALRRDGYEVLEASDGIECIGHLQPWMLFGEHGGAPDLIVSDIRMPGWSGLEILQLARARSLPTPVILITAFGSAETHAEAQRLGAAALFDKPFDLDDLRAVVRDLIPPRS